MEILSTPPAQASPRFPETSGLNMRRHIRKLFHTGLAAQGGLE
jgi:hypothetical protein